MLLMAGGRKEKEAKWGQRDIVDKSKPSGKCVLRSQLQSENITTLLMCLNWASRELGGGSFLATPPSKADFTFLWGHQPQLRIQTKVHRKVTKSSSEKDVLPSLLANLKYWWVGWGEQEMLTPGRLLTGCPRREPEVSKDVPGVKH